MTISRKDLKQLCDKHLVRYEKRLAHAEAGKTGYNKKELVIYLSFWKEVRAKEYNYSMLTDDARGEVDDAIEDAEVTGEITELTGVQRVA